jgi:hypothetical protein
VLLHGVEVDLVARVSVGTLEVGHKLSAQLRPGDEGPLGQVHEKRLGRIGQRHQEIFGHDGLISSRGEGQGGVDLQELGGVDTLIVFLQQMGLEHAWPDHHTEVWGKRHTTSPRSHRGRRGASDLPNRGSVHLIKVPVEVAILAAAPLPLALDGDAVVLARSIGLEFDPQIRCSETCYVH